MDFSAQRVHPSRVPSTWTKHEEEKRDSTIAYTVKESSTDMEHYNIIATPGHTPGRDSGSIFEGHFDEGEAAGSFQEALLAWRGDTRPKMGEMENTSLLDGHFDETEAAVIFQKALPVAMQQPQQQQAGSHGATFPGHGHWLLHHNV